MPGAIALFGSSLGGGIVAVRRSVLLGAWAAGLLCALWGAGLTTYLCFQDEIAAVLLRRQAEMQYSYEAQIGGLRAQIERSVTSAAVDREKLSGRIDALMARQGQIEARQSVLNTMAEQTLGPAGLAPGAGQSVARSNSAAAYAPPPLASPVEDTRERSSKPTPLPDQAPTLPERSRRTERPLKAGQSPSDRLSLLENAIERQSAEQSAVLALLQQSAKSRLGSLERVLGATGLQPDRLEPSGDTAEGFGGPLVPAAWNAATSSFEVATGDLGATILRFDRLRRVARSLPLTRPVSGTLEPTSPFGYRVDPFTRAAALHTGMDLRAETGTGVRATGPGRVTLAESSGGYGNMIEIEHGNGVSTRYAHLSIIGVSEGQEVKAGAIIGHVGSTGRSTGAHLHYETRVNGEPVNPQRFLQAGAQLAAPARSRYSMSSTSSPPP